MDSIDGMRTFVAVVESGSFKDAGIRLGISNKLASKYLRELEQQVGTRLLHRTTRSLSLTEAGTIYLAGCRDVLAVLDAVETRMETANTGLRGNLRVAVPITFGQIFVSSATRAFLEEHPALSVDLHMSDQHVNLAAEGFDLAIRIGNLRDSSLVARKLGQTVQRVVASPDYIERHGAPENPDALSRHNCLRDTNGSDPNSWTFQIEGTLQRVPVSGNLSVNNATTCLDYARAGAGLAQCPDIFLADDLKSGKLVEVLGDFPSGEINIQMVHLPNSSRPPKVTAYMDFLQKQFGRQ